MAVDGAATSAAERCAAVLRDRITAGELLPGTRLVEDDLVGPLGVSRNTLRESFRLLTHDGLLEHRLHRGVFVTVMDVYELLDLYRLRRVVECDAVRGLTGVEPDELVALHAEVDAGEAAVAAEDWLAVGSANMRFHQRLVALAGSPRMDRAARQMLAELRLVFHAVSHPRLLHGRYVARNRALVALLERGEFEAAADELDRYLRESERQLLDAYRRARQQEQTGPTVTPGDPGTRRTR